MSDMHIAHHKIVRSDARDASTISSTAVDRGMFANHVEVAHLEPSWFAVKLEILRIATNQSKWMNFVAASHACQ